MKTNVIFATVLIAISSSNVTAQEAVTVDPAVDRSFNKHFSGATGIKWSGCAKSISLAQFNYRDDFWVAYFSIDGTLITKGRKVNLIHELPVRVQGRIQAVKTSNEEKYGAISLGTMFEMINEGTEYLVPMGNNSVYLMFAIGVDGSVFLQKKTRLDIRPTHKSVLAKKN